MPSKEFRIFAIVLITILATAEFFLSYNTLYTEGEVMQGLYTFLIWLNLPFLIAAFWKPRLAVWASVILGALLLPWQTYQNRKLVQIHEEVIGVIRYIEAEKSTSGNFPLDLDEYQFQMPWVRDHMIYDKKKDTYRISYFMHTLGTSYWYESEGGFGYYPD